MMESFTYDSQHQSLCSSSGKNYSIHNVKAIRFADGVLLYESASTGIVEVTQDTIDLICAWDRYDYLMSQLSSKYNLDHNVCWNFVSLFREAQYSAQSIKRFVKDLNLFNSELECFLANKDYNLVSLLLLIFKLSYQLGQKQNPILQRIMTAKLVKEIARTEELEPYFLNIFEKVLSPQCRSGALKTGYDEYTKDSSSKSPKLISYATFRREFYKWFERHYLKLLHDECCLINNIPLTDEEGNECFVEFSSTEIDFTLETLKKLPKHSRQQQNLLGWLDKYQKIFICKSRDAKKTSL